MSLFELRLLTPENTIFAGNVSSLSVQTLDGEVGILPGHIPLFAALQPASSISIITEDGNKQTAAATGGFISVAVQKVTVFAATMTWIDASIPDINLDELLKGSDEYYQALAIMKAKAKYVS